jgi:ribosomal protein S6--L-glutamate ligase
MKLLILSGNPATPGWHVRDLERAACALGLAVWQGDFRRLAADAAQPTPPPGVGAVVVRSMPLGSLEQVVFRMDLLQQWHAAGLAVINPPRALELCIDKFLTTARLAAAGLPVPPTRTCQDAEAAMAAWQALGGDVVVKPLFGSEGRGIVRVSDADMAWRVFRTLERLQAVLYVQEFIAHPGYDLRVLVLAGRPVAAMRRYARAGWRTNVAQGGSTEPVVPSELQAALAVRAAEVVGAQVAGVDLLDAPDGRTLILEVNAVPGWRALARTTGVDIPRLMLTELVLPRLMPGSA